MALQGEAGLQTMALQGEAGIQTMALQGEAGMLSSGHQMLMEDCVAPAVIRKRKSSSDNLPVSLQRSNEVSVCREVIKTIYRATENQ